MTSVLASAPPAVPEHPRLRNKVFDVLVGVIAAHVVVVWLAAAADQRWVALVGLTLVVGLLSSAAQLFTRLSARLSGLLALAIGVSASVMGLALTAARVIKLGVDLERVLGLGSLLAGVALSVVGSRRVLRTFSRRRTRAVSVVAALVVAWNVLTPVTFAVYLTHPPATPVSGATPADAGFDYAEVDIPTSDGEHLAGWYIPSKNGAAVVLMHGSGSNRTATLAHGEMLAAHGFGVLMLDARGHGRSSGDAMDLGWYGGVDTRAGVDFLAMAPDVTRGIGLFGLSMGGESVLTEAADDPRVGAIVAEGAGKRSFAETKTLCCSLASIASMPMDWLSFAATDLLTPASPPIGLERAAGEIAAPMLLVSGSDPEETKLNAAYHAAATGSQWWSLPDTGHVQGLREHPDEYTSRVVQFLEQNLVQGDETA